MLYKIKNKIANVPDKEILITEPNHLTLATRMFLNTKKFNQISLFA